MRRLVYQLHSWLGLIAGLGLLVIGLTGSALVFKAEIDRALEPELVKIPDPAKPRLSPDAFHAAVQANLPDHIVQGWGRSPEPDLADAVYAVKPGEEDGRMIYVDPTNGKPLATDPEQSETFTNWMLELHYMLLADHAGMFVAGLLGALLCLLGTSGVYLYRGFWKTLFQLRWKRSARIFFSDLHKMVGITSTAFHLLLGVTGAWWNLSHIAGHWVEEEHEPVDPPRWTGQVSLDRLLAEAGQSIPGYQANWIALPFAPDGDVSFFGAVKGQGVLRSPYGSVVVFNGNTGELKSAVRACDGGFWTQVLDSFRPLHFGTFGGLPVKILWSLGGLAPGVLAVSGSVMWWKRRRISQRRAQVPQATASTTAPG